MPRTVQEQPEIQISSGKMIVSSLDVARHFEKEHKDVLKRIQITTECCPEDFTERNFALSEYADPPGRKLPCYDLTRDGFSLLVMGFTGKKALQWKIRYIQAFNAMEQALQSGRTTPRQIAHGLCNPE